MEKGGGGLLRVRGGWVGGEGVGGGGVKVVKLDTPPKMGKCQEAARLPGLTTYGHGRVEHLFKLIASPLSSI